MEIIGNHKELSVRITKAQGVGLCDIGCVRTNNEDNLVLQKIWTDNFMLAVVVDGVGGQEGGEVAAAIAAESIPRFLESYSNGDPQELLCQAVQQANNDIFDKREHDNKLAYMSCVLTAVLLDGRLGKAYMAHVGDSRLYLYSDGTLKKLSHDHSLIGYREEMGDLSEEEAMHHPQRNIISRDVGSERQESTEFIESGAFDLYGDSILMLCSDGLCDMITSKEMLGILKKEDTVENKCGMLVDAAKSVGGRDNITVILVEHKSKKNTSYKKNITNDDVSNVHSVRKEGQRIGDINIHSQPLSHKSDKTEKKTSFIHKCTLAVLLVVVALVVGFMVGKLSLGNKEPEVINLTAPTDVVDTSSLQTPFLSEKIMVEDFRTSKGLLTGSLDVLSLSQIADIFENTCYKSIDNCLADSLNIIATKHKIEYLNLVEIGKEVWCECQLISKDSIDYKFSSKLFTEQGIMAQGECVFSLINK